MRKVIGLVVLLSMICAVPAFAAEASRCPPETPLLKIDTVEVCVPPTIHKAVADVGIAKMNAEIAKMNAEAVKMNAEAAKTEVETLTQN